MCYYLHGALLKVKSISLCYQLVLGEFSHPRLPSSPPPIHPLSISQVIGAPVREVDLLLLLLSSKSALHLTGPTA